VEEEMHFEIRLIDDNNDVVFLSKNQLSDSTETHFPIPIVAGEIALMGFWFIPRTSNMNEDEFTGL
jgi:hypothetical protein